jgi:DNA-binding XRE family transcriptional regulator
MKTLDQKMKSIGRARRKKVEARTAGLIAEEMTLQELRQARKLTQVRMAKALGISQDGVSRLEKRSDLLLSTLRKSVVAMGATCPRLLNFLTVSQSFCPASPKYSGALRRPDRNHFSRSKSGSFAVGQSATCCALVKKSIGHFQNRV